MNLWGKWKGKAGKGSGTVKIYRQILFWEKQTKRVRKKREKKILGVKTAGRGGKK